VNLAISYASLNYAALAEQVIRPGVASFMYFAPLMNNFTTAQQNGDFYSMGLTFSTLWKYFFDGSIMN